MGMSKRKHSIKKTPRYTKRQKLSIESLSCEILDMIMSYLGPSHQFVMKGVSKLFCEIVNWNPLHKYYKSHLIENYIIPCSLDYKRCTIQSEETFETMCCIGGLKKIAVITQDKRLSEVLHAGKSKSGEIGFDGGWNGYFIEVGRSGSESTISELIEECDIYKVYVLFGIVIRGDMELFLSFVKQYSIELYPKYWKYLLPGIIMGRNINLLKMAHKNLEKKLARASLNLEVGRGLEGVLSSCLRAISHTRNVVSIFKELATWNWNIETKKILGKNFGYLTIAQYKKEEHRDLVPILMESFFVPGEMIAEWILLHTCKPDYELATSLINEGVNLGLETILRCKLATYGCSFERNDVPIVLYCLRNLDVIPGNDSKLTEYFIRSASLEGMEYLVETKQSTWSDLFRATCNYFFNGLQDYGGMYNLDDIVFLDVLGCIKQCFRGVFLGRSYSKIIEKALLKNKTWVEGKKKEEIMFKGQLDAFHNWITTVLTTQDLKTD